MELRILAHMADDESMRSAFERGEDIHATTAAAIYDTPLKDVNAMQRSNAKRINFGIAYGMGPFALAQNTGMSMDEAREFINKYFARFPKVKAWLDNTKFIAAEQGYVETVLGRRRYFPELRAGSGAAELMKRRAEREAINHPVQGSAADIMKIAMIRIHAALREGSYAAKMTLQVHDELVFDCPTSELEAVSKLVKREMEGAYSMSVPLRADVVSGKTGTIAHNHVSFYSSSMTTSVAPTTKPTSRRIKQGGFFSNTLPFWLLLPTLLVMGAIEFYPGFYSIWLAFQDKQAGVNKFIGLRNFERILDSAAFKESVGHTVVFLVGYILFTMAVSFGIALLLNRKMKLSGVYLTLLFIPWVIADIIAGLVWGLLVVPGYGTFSPLLSNPMLFPPNGISIGSDPPPPQLIAGFPFSARTRHDLSHHRLGLAGLAVHHVAHSGRAANRAA